MSSNTGENVDRDQLCGGGGGHGSNSGEIINKNESSCEQNNVDCITKGINNVAVLDNTSLCANCGKEGNSDDDDMNTCNKCNQ